MVDVVPHAPGRLLHLRPGQVQRFPVNAEGRLAKLDAVLVMLNAAFPPRLPQLASLLDGFGPAGWTLPPGEH